MGPNFSDVDEITSTFQNASDVENDGRISKGRSNRGKQNDVKVEPRYCQPWAMTSPGHQRFPIKCRLRTGNTHNLPISQRLTSDVSDINCSDEELWNTLDLVDSPEFLIQHPSNTDSEVDIHGDQSEDTRESPRETDSLPQQIPWEAKLLSSTGTSDVDDPEGHRQNVSNRKKKIRASRGTTHMRSGRRPDRSVVSKKPCWKRCRHHHTRAQLASGDVSTCLDTSPSDVEEIACKSTHANYRQSLLRRDELDGPNEALMVRCTTSPQATEANSEDDQTGGDTLVLKKVEGPAKPQEPEAYSQLEMHHCNVCCDIDDPSSVCELCGLAFCAPCSNHHFNDHATELQDRLESLRYMVTSIGRSQSRDRLTLGIDRAVEELISASNKALMRALATYRSTAARCDTFIGSLVDLRIKLSSSLKFLHRQIPNALVTEDVYELSYFKKVAEDVNKRLEELAISMKNPTSREIFNLSLSSIYSARGPLHGPNNLFLSLGSFIYLPGLSDLQPNINFFFQAPETMHFKDQEEEEN